MFMNFLNLKHLGEVDEEQQLRKQHFDIRAKDILSSTSNVPLNQQAILKKLSSELSQVSKIKRKETVGGNRQIPDILTYAMDQLQFSDIRRSYLQPTRETEPAAILYPLVETNISQSQKSDTERVSIGQDRSPSLQYRIFPKFRMDLFERCEQIEYNYMLENGDSIRSIKKQVAKSSRRDARIPSNFKKEKTFVHLCWIYMWCGTFKQQERKEKFFRLN